LCRGIRSGRLSATGLLRKLGNHGILVIKDVTSILSADRHTRGPVLAALREVYDGRWERNVGSDGGLTLTCIGRLVIVGAVTTAWDTAHSVIAAAALIWFLWFARDLAMYFAAGLIRLPPVF